MEIKEHIECHAQVAGLEGDVNRLATDLFEAIHEASDLQRANQLMEKNCSKARR